MYYKASCASPIGELILAEKDGFLTALVMKGQKYEELHIPAEAVCRETPVLKEAFAWLDAYFAGQCPDPSALPLAPEGTPFRRRVWQELLKIPYGKTRTYGELSAVLGGSPRAVGGAVGHNPISIIIPCHRVVGIGGSLTGYAGGVDRKAFLLRLEAGLD